MADDLGISVSVKTSLAEDTFYLRRLTGTEQVSRGFELRLELLSADPDIDFTALLGQPVTVEVSPGGTLVRKFAGIAAKVGQTGTEGNYIVYEMLVVPWLWMLSRSACCDLWNETPTADIVKEILRKAPQPEFEVPSSGWSDRLYCVQYRESDYDFVSRLVEDEGFYYFFEPSGEFHKMIVADGAQAPAKVHEVKYSGSETHGQDFTVTSFGKTQELTTGEYQMVDFDYADPKLGEPMEAVPSAVETGSAPADTTWYDFPGEFGKITGGDTGKLRDRVKLRIAEEDAKAIVFRGKSRIWEIAAGHGIRLEGAYREEYDGDYLVTRVTHDFKMAGGLEAGAGSQEYSYSNEFECVPDGVRFVPPRLSPKPRIRGVHTALVKEAIDDKGRVRVSFPWCKDKLSCWVRVSQGWAGGGWGIQWHPRVGHEVLIHFFEGDPDLPVIIGRVYNGENEGPYSDKHSRGGVKSRSMDGNPDNFNEIRFEDEKGNEELFIHAEKNHVIEVENDESKDIGNNRSEKVKKDVSIRIGGDRSETVEGKRSLSVTGNKEESVSGDKSISVTKGHTETITLAAKIDVGEAMTINVGKALTIAAGTTGGISSKEGMTVAAGKEATYTVGEAWTMDVGKGAKLTIKEEWGAEAKKIQIEGKDEIVLKAGSASITLKQNGDIVIDGKVIDVKGSGDVKIKGSKAQVN